MDNASQYPLTIRTKWPPTPKPKPKVDRSRLTYMTNIQACCVRGCPSGARARGVRFPHNEQLGNKWVEETQVPLSYHEVKASGLRVCHSHFLATDFYTCHNGTAFKVKHNVVPSVNLPGREETSLQNTSGTEDVHASVGKISCNGNNHVMKET